MKTIDLDPALRTDPRFGRQRFSAKAAYIELYMYAASTENWGVFDSTIEDIAWILGRSNDIELMQKDIDSLVGVGLLVLHNTGSLEIAGFGEIQKRIVANRDYYKKLQADRRAGKAKAQATPQPDQDEAPQPDSDYADVTHNNNVTSGDVAHNNNVTQPDVNSITKPNLTKLNLTKPNEVIAQSATPASPDRNSSSKPSKPKTDNPNPRGEMFVAVAKVCNIPTDDQRSVKNINATANWLVGKKINPETLSDFLSWWKENHWLGKRGDRPKPGDIVTNWLEFEAGPKMPQQQTQSYANRPTKGEQQMSNLNAGIAMFLASQEKN